MPKKRFQPEEIIGKLRQVGVQFGRGKKVAEILHGGCVIEPTSPRRKYLHCGNAWGRASLDGCSDEYSRRAPASV
jgi:hypothetical protein